MPTSNMGTTLALISSMLFRIVITHETPEPYEDSFLDDVAPPKGFFDAFRRGNFPQLHPEQHSSVTYDVLVAGWIYAACTLTFSLLLVVPGVRRWRGRLSAFIRIGFGVGIWLNIVLFLFGQDWEVAHIQGVQTPYRSLLPAKVTANIGVRIGLRSVNITLQGHTQNNSGKFGDFVYGRCHKCMTYTLTVESRNPKNISVANTDPEGDPRVQEFKNGLMNETIDYNERFSWDNRGWTTGRAGFGPSAGQFNQEFREAQRRGTPYPILWIAEYFTVDGEGLRWGRFYLQAGYFTHIFVWLAWSTWCLALILYNMLPRYGAYLTLMTSISLCIANVIYATQRNSNPLRIPFHFEGCTNLSDVGDNSQCIMTFHYSWCFWLCAATGTTCFIIGIVVLVLDQYFPTPLNDFFNMDFKELEVDHAAASNSCVGSNSVITVESSQSATAGTSASVSIVDDTHVDDISWRSDSSTAKRRSPISNELLQSSTPPRDDSSGGDVTMTAYVSAFNPATSSASYDVRGGSRCATSSQENESTSSSGADHEIPPPDDGIDAFTSHL